MCKQKNVDNITIFLGEVTTHPSQVSHVACLSSEEGVLGVNVDNITSDIISRWIDHSSIPGGRQHVSGARKVL